MQKITQLWNTGCLGKLAIGLIGLIVLSCIGSALGSRRPVQQAVAPTIAPKMIATLAPATATPLPTNIPPRTNAPSPTAIPTSIPKPTAKPQPTKAPEPTAVPQSIVVPTSTTEPTAEPPRTTDPVGVAPLDKNNCPPDAPIKGNIVDRGSRKGEKIYHIPGSPSYQQTNPERCFATSADAESAGFRAPAR